MTAIWQDYVMQKAKGNTAVPGNRVCLEKHRMLWGCGARYTTAVINSAFLSYMLKMHENHIHAPPRPIEGFQHRI